MAIRPHEIFNESSGDKVHVAIRRAYGSLLSNEKSITDSFDQIAMTPPPYVKYKYLPCGLSHELRIFKFTKCMDVIKICSSDNYIIW